MVIKKIASLQFLHLQNIFLLYIIVTSRFQQLQPFSHSFLCSSDPLKLDTQKGKKKKKVRDPGEKKMIHFENQKTTYGPHRKIAL